MWTYRDRTLVGLLGGALLAACATAPESDLPADLLDGEEEFIQIRKPDAEEVITSIHALGDAPGGVSDGSDDFYLAIRRDVLAERWFLSATMKQYHPGNASSAAAASLGTRVVSFRIQNGKLFVFDASDQFKASELFDPEVLLEAYPMVDFDSFHRLRGSGAYVLVDPAAGLNRFLVTGELVADPDQADFGAFPLRIGLSYMQGFRAISDGATFEQVFTGEVDGGAGATTAWGTLGISLRRYQEGEGYVPTEDPGAPHYFLSDSRIIPDAFRTTVSNPVRWNLHPGRPPIRVAITAGAARAQEAFPGFDVSGALQRGVEDWNQVLGYEAFDAFLVDDDEVRDDDASTVLVDYPGAGNGFAFADWRHNPNTAEILGGSVYFGGEFFEVMAGFEDDAVEPPSSPSSPAAAAPVFLWGGMPARRPACRYPVPDYGGRDLGALRADTSLTAQEKGARYIEEVMAHEWGHVLGLRHNFKGSLVPPGSSVMDYNLQAEAVAIDIPGSYDVDAIRHLYQLDERLPEQPFCTDEDTLVDPNCVRFDRGADPLRDYWQALYELVASFLFDFGDPADILDFGGLPEILAFARDAGFVDPADRRFALELALGRARSPLAPADAADPFIAAQASAMADFVLRRLVLDPPELRGAIGGDATDPDVLALVIEQAGLMAANDDGARTFALRRTCVDVLERLQSEAALAELRAVRDRVAAALAGGEVSEEETSLTQDLLSRIDAALTPYFD